MTFEAFRFLKRRRERQERREAELRAERHAEREHQRILVELFFNKLVEVIAKQQESLLAIADAMKSNSDALHTWLKGFQTSAEALPSSTIREDDEWAAEQRRLGNLGDPNAFPVDAPPEFQLAFVLQQMEKDREEFDREV